MEYATLPDNFSEMRLSPYRKDFTHSYVFGVFPIIELTDHHPSAVFRIITSTKLSAEGRKMLSERADRLNIRLETDDRVIERLSPKDNCFAIAAFSKFYCAPDPAADHAVLVNPSDKGNLGTIVRTLTAFGFKDLAVIRPCADLFDPHTVRASMGALFRIRPSLFDSFEEYARVSGARRNFYPFMLNGQPMENIVPDRTLPCSLIFGNESSGLDDSYLELGTPVRITHENTVDSLNLTIAAGIGMHWFHASGR